MAQSPLPPVPPTIVWNVDADGDWSTVADWTPKHLPGSTDDVSINTTDLHTIIHSTGTDTVHTLNVGNDSLVASGGSLTVTSTSSFANGVTLSGQGTLSLGAGATATSLTQGGGTISGAGTLTVSGAASFGVAGYVEETGTGTTLLESASTLNGAYFGLDAGRVLENQSAFAMTAGFIELGFTHYNSVGGGSIQNDAGAVFNLQGGRGIYANLGVTSITNAGTFEQTVTTRTSYVNPTFTNTGLVSVQSGTVKFGGGFTNSGAGTISAGGGTLQFVGGIANLAGTTLTGGTFEADAGGTVELNQNSKIVTDSATIVLNGANSVIQGFNTTTGKEVSIDSSLATISTVGTLDLLGGRGWSSKTAMSNAGSLILGGGTFGPASLANSGTVSGFGVVATTLTNSGVISALGGQILSLVGGTLTNLVGTALTGGTFVIGAGATLQCR